jgi:HlyD family secretion protein
VRPTPRLRLRWVALAALAVVLLALALRPAPVVVEIATVTRGPLVVTLDEQGETRSHDRYSVAAPVAGRLLRSTLHEGDRVAAGQVVARLAPLPLSPQERALQQARLEQATAALRDRESEARHVGGDLEQARRDVARLEDLFTRGLVPKQQLEQARVAALTLAVDVDAASYRVRAAEAERRAALAGLLAVREVARNGRATVLDVEAPAAGRVLRIPEPDERVVAAGAPLVVIGDLEHLEVVVEMLTADAVRIAPGMRARLEGWGGERPLAARVRRVEPYAFTKVSALGVEEQRSNVILDFVDAPGPLGDGYRVTARIVVWSGEDVPQVPVTALFRCGQPWCVYVDDDGRARRREVAVGEMNMERAHVRAGLSPGERVVVRPADALTEGSRIRVAR